MVKTEDNFTIFALAAALIVLSLHCTVLKKPDLENSEDERMTRPGSLKKKALNASTKFRHYWTKRGQRSSKVMPVSLDEGPDSKNSRQLMHFAKLSFLKNCYHLDMMTLI
ncbi:hypothetical protein NL676_015507 [Syzygium grande]|nr:hypothetical protein NL676_015507 [Syzygium grande]